jgi:DNA-binding transcriptional MerR regulator
MVTSENEQAAETAATTAGEVYRQARDQAAARAGYDVQAGLDRLSAWMRDDDSDSGIGLRAAPAGRPRKTRDEPGQMAAAQGSGSVEHGESAGYRGPIACAAAGITYKQLDYWARTGLVEPSVRAAQGPGSVRLYSFSDILILKVVKRLLDTGISLQQIRAVVNHLRDRRTDDLAQVTLMSDGVSVYENMSPDELADQLTSGQGVFAIALGRVWQEVSGDLAELPGPLAGADSFAGYEVPPGRGHQSTEEIA